ncbi:MAG: RNase adapter RapZ [Novosphingobium sp.]
MLLITGLLGAGKTTVLRVLEDLGWETIDNFPIRLLDRLIDSADAPPLEERAPLAIGFDSRTRGFDAGKVIERVKKLVAQPDLELTTLFLDCAGAGWNGAGKTRRRHPLAGLARCCRHRRRARIVRSAPALSGHGDFHHPVHLQRSATGDPRAVPARCAPQTLTVSILFRVCPRRTADRRSGVRHAFLGNPHWDPALRELTGRDAAVGDHVRKGPAFAGPSPGFAI